MQVPNPFHSPPCTRKFLSFPNFIAKRKKIDAISDHWQKMALAISAQLSTASLSRQIRHYFLPRFLIGLQHFLEMDFPPFSPVDFWQQILVLARGISLWVEASVQMKKEGLLGGVEESDIISLQAQFFSLLPSSPQFFSTSFLDPPQRGGKISFSLFYFFQTLARLLFHVVSGFPVRKGKFEAEITGFQFQKHILGPKGDSLLILFIEPREKRGIVPIFKLSGR